MATYGNGDKFGFDSWNPMLDDYKNEKFNQYNSGPGAEIDPALQPAHQHDGNEASNKHRSPKPYLVLKYVPVNMTTQAVENICKRFGRIRQIRTSTKNDYYFVEVESVADMESVYRGLENNEYGIQVLIGKQFNKNGDNNKGNYNNANADHLPPIQSKNEINFENRSYLTSNKKPTRPKFKSEQIYHSQSELLRLIDDDAHALERNGQIDANFEQYNQKYKYRTGRAYIEMPQKTKTFIQEKSLQSLGKYNANEEIYKNSDTGRKPTNLGKCSICQSVCDIICRRCSTYYCGVACQKRDWQVHRYVCGKPKNLETIQNHVAKNDMEVKKTFSNSTTPPKANESTSNNAPPVVAKDRMPPSGHLVQISCISKPNVVFIRSKTVEQNISFFETISKLQAIGNKLKKLHEPPQCGRMVVAKFEGQYNRAMVINIQKSGEIRLMYVDYGNLDVKLYDELYEMPVDFSIIHPHAMPVILKDVPDCYMSERLRKFLYSYVDGCTLMIKYKMDDDLVPGKGVYQVELIDQATSQNFNNTIVTLSKAHEPIDCEEIYFRSYLAHKSIPTGDGISLVIMDNSLLNTGCISLTTKECALEIEKFQEECQRYADSLKEQEYAPRVDELCIVRYDLDKKWYRARCLDLVGDGFPTVVFFDYGNIAIVNIKDIRRYPAQFTLPVYTVDCEIEGLPEMCDEKIVAKLEELLPIGTTIQCDRVKELEENQFYVITSTKIIENLKETGVL